MPKHPRPIATPSELKLIRALTKHGFRVQSNVELHGYYPDIRIIGTNIIVEVDGSIHKIPSVHERDKERSKHLRRHGYKIIRFTNYQVAKDCNKIIAKICDEILKQQKKNQKYLP
jgi:very-short-patch-repair endonuclease